jgi:hypothetical protein
MLGDDRRNVVERLEGAFSLADGSRPARHEREEGLAVPLLGMNGSGGAICQAGNPPNCSGASAMNSR